MKVQIVQVQSLITGYKEVVPVYKLQLLYTYKVQNTKVISDT
jgi:hypothetical protein